MCRFSSKKAQTRCRNVGGHLEKVKGMRSLYGNKKMGSSKKVVVSGAFTALRLTFSSPLNVPKRFAILLVGVMYWHRSIRGFHKHRCSSFPRMNWIYPRVFPSRLKRIKLATVISIERKKRKKRDFFGGTPHLHRNCEFSSCFCCLSRERSCRKAKAS